jgi:hypothetical protein
MSKNIFESRVKVSQIIENQLPEFILDESPKFTEFLKQYYISQEYQGAPIDISENIDQYLKLDNLSPEVINGSTSLSDDISSDSVSISVGSTKGFPNQYGLLKIGNEIITYTAITDNTFVGCIRGFSGITDYHDDLNAQELIFETTVAESHKKDDEVVNLSSLFLLEIYKKIKYTFTPGLENLDFVDDLNAKNFIKESVSLYQSKGTEESFRILFNVLFGETPKIIDLEKYLTKPSSAKYIRREVIVVESISGNPLNLKGQTIRKNNDDNTFASVSEVEIVSRGIKSYYRLSLFVGYDDSFPTISGKFDITGNSRVVENIQQNSRVITVDSTIGFPKSGLLYCDDNIISYENKSVNQFLGCDGIQNDIKASSLIGSNETYYGYENGDLSKKVEFRITGVLSEYKNISQNDTISAGEKIFINNLGEKIENPVGLKTKKELFANTWIYNTSSRMQIDSFSSGFISQFILKSDIDKSRLKVGDEIEILKKNSEVIAVESLFVTQITDRQVNTSDVFTLSPNEEYDIRRKIKKSSSEIVPIEYGNNAIISDVQNVYIENDEYFYVASNSLPSYEIKTRVIKYDISSLSDFDSNSEKYGIFNFNEEVKFFTGDEIVYLYDNIPISELSNTNYYVEVLGTLNQIRLYVSRSFIGTENYIKIKELPAGTHTFILNKQKENLISSQNLLKKFPINPTILTESIDVTQPGTVGMLVNGVELSSYKSGDYVFYGPLEAVEILNSGTNYDVINPPLLQISSGDSLIQPVLKGSVKFVYVDPQDFDIDVNVSVSISGGNGTGASFDPVIKKSFRELRFDAREILIGGGLDVDTETITFLSDHNLKNGEEITYEPLNNQPIGIGTFGSFNFDQNKTLKKNSSYYTKIINNKTIQLYESFENYSSGINTVGFTTISNSGIHLFKTKLKNTLSEIKVINEGQGYENRKLIVNQTGISTTDNLISFTNHGFNEGEILSYNYEDAPIVGLSSLNRYKVLKLDNNNFRLSDVGIGGTNNDNYNRRNYVKFDSFGSGYHYFSYPEITLQVNYSSIAIGSTNFSGSITATPVVRGEIIGTYVYEPGQDYGSSIINFNKKPNIIVKNGRSAQLKPVILNGRIEKVIVLYGGVEYYSQPSIKIIGNGSGAVLRAEIIGGKIVNVIVVNSGANYTQNETSLVVESAGSGASFDAKIRRLSVNKNFVYGDEILESKNNNLQYSVIGYSNYVQSQFGDLGGNHSPIIGWSYDGNPIYGSYGYSNPLDKNSSIKKLESGYTLDQSNVYNRPTAFNLGFFVEDYQFDNSGDLDVFNGRYCVTPEFPNGVYAYFATIQSDLFGNLNGQFPYFIGDYYRSKYITENNSINQNFDFNSSNLKRNTFPYNNNELFADNDFIVESPELKNQITVVESVFSGSIDNIDVIERGNNYKVGDEVEFDEENTSGSGLSATVSKIKGKDIKEIRTIFNSYPNSILTWTNNSEIKVTILPNHEVQNLDLVSISGLSTNLSNISGIYPSNVQNFNTTLLSDIQLPIVTGIVTDIYVSRLSNDVSVGSSLSINDEIFSIINLYPKENVLRVIRDSVGSSHSTTSLITLIPNTLAIASKKNIDYFNSKLNDLFYFNPKQSVGVGRTIGFGFTTNYVIGDNNIQISIPTQSIYLPDHKFNTNQKLIFRKNTASLPISVANTESSTAFNLLDGTDNQIVYAIKKSNNYIGIVTEVGLTTTSNGLFFVNNGSDDYRYSLETDFYQEKAEVIRTKSIVSLSTSHSLLDNDIINLIARPSLSVGVGTSLFVSVKYDAINQRILFDTIGFSSSSINPNDNTVNIVGNTFNTGDKVFYAANSLPAGLTTDFYYVRKVDSVKFNLCDTFTDSVTSPPKIVNFGSSGGSAHEISKVNPNIKCIKNNNLVFNTSDSSLSGYDFKIYYDKEFNKEFISIEGNEEVSVVKTGIVGLSTSFVTVKYSSNLPEKLFYSLEKDGESVKSDNEVINSSEINFISSIYEGTYKISGIGTTTFNLILRNIPERLYYEDSECDDLSYTTSSTNDEGPIEEVEIISSGVNYKKIPIFVDVNSQNGRGAYLLPKSNTVGLINETRILNSGFDYSSDKTLSPSALIPSTIIIESSSQIESIDVLSGGKNYISAPKVVTVDSRTGKKIDSGILEANLFGNSISSIDIIDPPRGLPYDFVDIKTINNNNSVGIQSVETGSSGLVTCYLVTPSNGFSIEPFEIGDEIFVEGIQKYSLDGDGFNSEDYGYRFFIVKNYQNSGTLLQRKLEYDLSGITTNVGIAKTIQESFSFITNEKNYPKFSVNQKYSNFIINESVLVKTDLDFIETDIKISSYDKSTIKVVGKYKLSEGNIILGKESGSFATINQIKINNGEFVIDYSYRSNNGWSDNIGILNDNTQVIPDNDYYQNLSYSIKSSKEWNDIVTPVNNILHTSGLKNFSDTEIVSISPFGINSVDDYTRTIYDIYRENRVDTINNFDFGLDVDVTNESSKYVRLLNKKLTNYFELKTNRVLQIDDISNEFSNSNSGVVLYSNISDIIPQEKFNQFLIQIVNKQNNQIQFTEVVTINDSKDIYTLEKGSIRNQELSLGDITGVIDDSNAYLRFSPSNPFDFDYEIKVLSTSFESFSSGISTISVGFVDLIGFNFPVNSGVTTSIVSKSLGETSSLYLGIQIIDSLSNEMNYVELYVDSDGDDTYTTEYYFDSNDGISSDLLGEFSADINDGKLNVIYANNTSNNVILRSKTVGFGSTSVGIGTYRFKKTGQLDGFERTVVYNSDYYNNISSPTSIISLNKNNFTSSKLTLKVSDNSQSALHQVLFIHDGNEIHTVQYPYLSSNKSSGIGTFGGEYNGNNINIVFYPDNDIDGVVNILTFSQSFYTDSDYRNIPESLRYFDIEETVGAFRYFGVNSDNLNRLNFSATYLGTPIFQKIINFSDNSVVNLETGEFNIANHFFSNGEELLYTPNSSFLGVGKSPVGIGSTLDSVGIVTDKLPPSVFVIKVNNDTFKLATRKDYANVGIHVTFTSIGEGNAHELEMVKKNEKTLITIDNIIQSPISYSLIDYTVNNGSSLGPSTSFIPLSGISSIGIGDLLKIDDEYVKVNNVGFGLSIVGPISFTGNIPLVEVVRGFVGTSATSHIDSSVAELYRGSYNIFGNEIFFTDPPKGNVNSSLLSNQTNLESIKSSFNGRVFLKKDYTSNQVYDDISYKFNGIDQNYTLSSQGISTVGFGTTGGNGIVIINGIFQTPSTENNLSKNYSILEDISSGISSIRFSGITSSNGSIIISDYDVNSNQLPRGGIIVSLGSTPGLGYAPLVGASATAIVSSGSIVSIGIGTTGSYGSGYRNPVSIAVTESGHIGSQAILNAVVGMGGTLSFSIIDGGSGYVNPIIQISSPSYENLPVIGVSRISSGSTTDTGVGLLLNVEIGASSTTGIGSTLFEVSSFKITRQGYGFRKGDIFKPVGLVTAYELNSPIYDFELTVLETFTDSFAAWQFGEVDYIDSIRIYQNGSRTRFPLFYDSKLLSFEKNLNDQDSQLIDFDSNLIIFINGILQEPKKSYNFNGGSTFTFTNPPNPDDEISIFFYRGSSDDSGFVETSETIKEGDNIQLTYNSRIPSTKTQNMRTVSSIRSSDTLETILYDNQGVDEVNYKPLNWTKQKVDKIIDGNIISKSRDSIEPQIYPTAKIIKSLTDTDDTIFVDSIDLFNYENVPSIDLEFNAVIFSGKADPISGEVDILVSNSGSIDSIIITNSGSGYIGTISDVKISLPQELGGIRAEATISITNGSLSSPINITNPGSGYTTSVKVYGYISPPTTEYENIDNISSIDGLSCNIVGINTSIGIGTNLAISFTLDPLLSPFVGLSSGYYVYIYDTIVGGGLTSIINNDQEIVGIGTKLVDNIYYINAFDTSVGIITCNIQSTSSIASIGVGTTGGIVGKMSYGRITGFNRSSSPISLDLSSFTVDSGLSTFPTIQRRGYGLRNTGSISKII